MASQKVGIPRMRTPTDVYAIELQAQHTIQSDDLLKICHLASVENIFEKIESFSFEQFFGFACHLFITTESQHTREQLALILPKFGSIAVFSLLKISHHLSTADNSLQREQQLAELAMSSLKAMPVASLVIGLAQMIEAEENDDLYIARSSTARTNGLSTNGLSVEKRLHQSQYSSGNLMDVIVPALITLTAHHGDSILLLLSQKISSATWNSLQQRLLQELSALRTQSTLPHNGTHRIKIKVQNSDLERVEVAC